jgi:hypothetical protein
VILLGQPRDSLGESLRREGYAVYEELVSGAAAIIVRVGDCFDPDEARRVRAALGTRGRVIVACRASRVIEVWTTLRRVGLESKRTLFVHGAAGAVDSIILARVAKRGGLSVQIVTTNESA